MASSNARNGDEFASEEEGAEESEADEEEMNEEEGDDEDYVPPEGILLHLEATDVSLRSTTGVTHTEAEPVNAIVSPERGYEVIDVAESQPLKEGAKGSQNEKEAESVQDRAFLCDPDLLLPSCPICMERWAGQGVHRVCCIPCGHLYGRSCLERWVKRCGESFSRCPQCKKRFKPKEIINLYAPQVAVLNDELEKELGILRQKNESLEAEKDAEEYKQTKKVCIRQGSTGATRVTVLDFFKKSPIPPLQGSTEGPRVREIVLQDEIQFDGARVLDIDAFCQVVLISGKTLRWGAGYSLTKVSLLCPYALQSTALPEDMGAVKDLHFSPINAVLPGRLALLASLGKKLSVFSMESNNIVLAYNLPVPAWSCSWDLNSPHLIYTGLQNGMLLTFDIRQTSSPLVSRPGLSPQPVHTIHSLPYNGPGTLLTASAMGPSIWKNDGLSTNILPEMESHGVCISLACGGDSAADAIATFRPRVQPTDGAASSQASQGHVRLGTHKHLKRTDNGQFCRHGVACGNVSDVRMCRSAVISGEHSGVAFVYPDEASHGLCVWDLESFQVNQRLKPHEYPVLDVKFSKQNLGPGLLGCISETNLQIFRV